jgi:hypothetical protein
LQLNLSPTSITNLKVIVRMRTYTHWLWPSNSYFTERLVRYLSKQIHQPDSTGEGLGRLTY